MVSDAVFWIEIPLAQNKPAVIGMRLSALNSCVKCGALREATADFCAECTWPFSLDAWSQSIHRVRRITIDTCCINSKRQDPALNKLEQWAERDCLELQRADEMLIEVLRPGGEGFIDKVLATEEHPGLFTIGSSMIGGGDVLAGPNLQDELRGILFPHPTLTRNQLSDIQHLHEHIRTGGDIFVSTDGKAFLNDGRQGKLHRMGIWVFRPNALVDFLKSIYAWE